MSFFWVLFKYTQLHKFSSYNQAVTHFVQKIARRRESFANRTPRHGHACQKATHGVRAETADGPVEDRDGRRGHRDQTCGRNIHTEILENDGW